MRRSSLRLRLVAGGTVAILIALTIAGIGLVLLFERHVARTLADDLDVHLKQLLAGIDIDAEGHLVMTRPPTERESQMIVKFFETQMRRFFEKELDAAAVAGPGPGDTNERAAWVALVRVLFNLDEAIVKG